VVLFRTIFGNLAVGPSAEDQTSRHEASTETAILADLHTKATNMLPALERYEISATYAGLRPATEFQDYQVRTDPGCNYTSVGGIRSTGLSAALGLARHVAENISLDASGQKPITNPLLPDPDRLSEYHPRDWQIPGHGGIICHCEMVTRREILAALDGPMPPATLQGLKRRTRVCMGRCQGFYCTGPLAALTAGRLHPPLGVSDG